MSTLLQEIQKIAIKAVQATNPVEFVIGTVTGDSPLSVRLSESSITISGDSLILSQAVVERKLMIKKHTHTIGTDLQTHTHPYSGTCAVVIPPDTAPITGESAGNTSASTQLQPTTKVDDTVLDVVYSEHGQELEEQVEKSDDDVVITFNRGLAKGDKVLMLKVCEGQRFVILSRVFLQPDDEGD